MNYLARLRGITTPQGGGRETPAALRKNPGTPIRGTDKTDKSPFCQSQGLLSVPDFGKKPQPAPAPAPPVKPPAGPAPSCEDWAERAAILEFDAGLTRAQAEAQATCRRWLIQEPGAGGWRDATFTPAASRAEIQAWHPDALAILPADDDADPWGDPEWEPGHPEEDPGAAFYAALFADLPGPRAFLTLSPADTHAAVVAGLLPPADARGAVLLAIKTPQGYALLTIPAARWDGLAFLEKITLH